MWSFKKVISELMLAIMLLPLLFAGSAAAEGMAYREIPVKLTVQVDGFNHGLVDLATTLQPGEVCKVELLSASGTGYQWQLEGESSFVQVAQAGTESLSDDKQLVGGPLRETYIVKAGDQAGTETIRFTLARPWEDKSLAVKTVAITVKVQQGK